MTDANKKPSPLAFTREELILINNALNEVCHGISFSDGEFQTRLGYARTQALKVLAKVARAIESGELS